MKPGETKVIRQISSYSELTADGSLMFIFFCYDLPSLCHLHCHRKRSKLSNNNALCLKTDSDASDASVMHSFWQNTVESEIQTRIMEFAATTMGELYLLSQTCKQWDEILNQDPDTADPIWHRIAKRYYGDDRRHLRRLEIMDSACRHEDNTEWRQLLFIERVPTLGIFSGEIGPYLKLLAWVFSSDRVLPYYTLSWTEGIVQCTVSAKEYWLSLGIGHHQRRVRGIDAFPVAFTDRSIEENFEDMKFQVHYTDHDYTVANFESECRIIHRWLHVFGFHHDDFSIDPPEAYHEQGLYGYINVTLIDRYRHQGKRVLCLGSMTIKEEPSTHSHETRGMQNFGYWEISAEEGEPVKRKLIHYSTQPFVYNN